MRGSGLSVHFPSGLQATILDAETSKNTVTYGNGELQPSPFPCILEQSWRLYELQNISSSEEVVFCPKGSLVLPYHVETQLHSFVIPQVSFLEHGYKTFGGFHGRA